MQTRAGPDGLHLFDRRTGVNILLDEISPPERTWARAPRQVSIALTNACDLTCGFCYAPKSPASLEASSVRTWMDELDKEDCLGVGFGGGEPTLYRHLADVCRHGAQYTGMAITLTTQGHHLTPQLLESLVGNVHFVRVSMDGVGRTYESIRGRPFDRLVSQLELIGSAVPFGINYVVNRLTIPDLATAANLATQLGARELLLLPEEGVKGRPGVDTETKDQLRDWVHAYRGPVSLAISETSALGFSTADPLPNETGLRAYAHIDASGRAKRSSYDTAGEAVGDDGVLAAIDRLECRDVA